MKNVKIFATYLLLVSLAVWMADCASGKISRNKIATYTGQVRDLRHFQEIEQDRFGRPVFKSPLEQKPGVVGNYYYTQVIGENERPIGYFKVGVVSVEDYDRYSVNFEMTEGGFQSGLEISEGLCDAIGYVKGIPEGTLLGAFVFLTVGGTSIVVGTLGGFTLDVIFNTGRLAQDVYTDLTEENEILMEYTRMNYDEKDRLKRVSLFALGEDGVIPLSMRRFRYEKKTKGRKATEPVETLYDVLVDEAGRQKEPTPIDDKGD